MSLNSDDFETMAPSEVLKDLVDGGFVDAETIARLVWGDRVDALLDEHPLAEFEVLVSPGSVSVHVTY